MNLKLQFQSKKRLWIILTVLIGIVIIDFVIEYPALLNKEFIFSKSIATKYSYASLSFQKTLSQQDILEIYLSIVGDKDSCYVEDHFYNNAGILISRNSDEFSINDILKRDISKYWKDKGFKSRFISRNDSVTNKGYVINGFTIIYLGPIKLVDGNILIGYEEYNNPLSAAGWLFKVEKSNGRWKTEAFTIPWIS